jgi:hypothetical protein
MATARAKPPRSIDRPSKRGGFVVKEQARLVVLWRLPHVEIAPRLEAIVKSALEVAGDRSLAYPRPSGDWLDPKPRPKIMSHVRAVAKQSTNATMSLASLDADATFELEYRAYLPVWIEGRVKGRPGLPFPRRGKASYLQVTFPREMLYERPADMMAWMVALLGHAPFSAATLGLALEGHYREQYRLGLEHVALDISSVDTVTDGCVTLERAVLEVGASGRKERKGERETTVHGADGCRSLRVEPHGRHGFTHRLRSALDRQRARQGRVCYRDRRAGLRFAAVDFAFVGLGLAAASLFAAPRHRRSWWRPWAR